MSMKNSSDTFGNRSRDLPVYSAVPQPLRYRVPPRRERHTRNRSVECESGGSCERQGRRFPVLPFPCKNSDFKMFNGNGLE
jgi:hypothetical protein